MSRGRAVALVLLTAPMWSAGGVLIKSVEWHPMAIAGGRSAFAALTVWALAGGALVVAAATLHGVITARETTAGPPRGA